MQNAFRVLQFQGVLRQNDKDQIPALKTTALPRFDTEKCFTLIDEKV